MRYRISAIPRTEFEGFWRAGIFFPNSPAFVILEDPPEAVLNEPMLICEAVPESEPEGQDPNPKTKKR